MIDHERMALIHAELDGDLSAEQRAELARLLLADPHARALRDDLRDLCSRLDALEQSELPPQFKESVLNRLPSVPLVSANRRTSFGSWRLAAMFAGLLTAGAIVYETLQGPAPGTRETAGTIAAADALTTVDSVAVGGGPVTGRATLYRDKSRLAVGLEVSAAEPVDVLISTEGHAFRINGLGSASPGGSARRTIALPGISMRGEEIELSFLIGGRTVGSATLRAPSGP